MSKYIPDISSKRWVIISPQRVLRPDDDYDERKRKNVCPFCPGQEKITTGEVLRYGKGEPDEKGWQVRVISNKFPITDFHEVIIHSPDEKKDITELPLSHTELIVKAYRERFNFYRQKGQVLIFCNHGEQAGASVAHPHSQLVVIPSQINIDELTREPMNNLVKESKSFYVYCPDFSQWPYEVWVAPKKTDTYFGDITDAEITDFAAILQDILKTMLKVYQKHKISHLPFGYNFYIHPHKNWYIRIIPRFVYRAGFELGTGLNVNIIDPLDAALAYKGIEDRMGNVMEKLQKHVERKI